jgi:hypothetical protein
VPVVWRGGSNNGTGNVVHRADAQEQLHPVNRQERPEGHQQQGRAGEMKKPTLKEWMKHHTEMHILAKQAAARLNRYIFDPETKLEMNRAIINNKGESKC